jgi:hypothetical protein
MGCCRTVAGNSHLEMRRAMAERLGYGPTDLHRIPTQGIGSLPGVGQHLHIADLKAGETVPDRDAPRLDDRDHQAARKQAPVAGSVGTCDREVSVLASRRIDATGDHDLMDAKVRQGAVNAQAGMEQQAANARQARRLPPEGVTTLSESLFRGLIARDEQV